MSLHSSIQQEIPKAMRAKDSVRLLVLRGLVTAFVNELVTKGRKAQGELSDEEALAVIRRSVKQRKDSIEQFQKGNRSDLASAEEAELTVLLAFLPASMSTAEIKKIVDAKKSQLGVVDKKETGKLMAEVMKELKGRADGSEVKALVEESLS